MTTFLIIISILAAVSLVLLFKKVNLPILEIVLAAIAIVSAIGVLAVLILFIYNFRLRGALTSEVIGLSFWGSALLLFGLTRDNLIKILTGVIAVPSYFLGLLSLIWPPIISIFVAIYMIIQPSTLEVALDDKHKIEVRSGSLLSCGQSIVITSLKFEILEEQVYLPDNHCLIGIKKIEPISHEGIKYSVLVYHDGKSNNKNPYELTFDLKHER